RERADDDAVAPYPLLPRLHHPLVVDRRRQHLVAPLERVAELAGLQRLRRIAADRDLFAVAAEELRQAPPHLLAPRRQLLPHRVGGREARVIEIALLRLEHRLG